MGMDGYLSEPDELRVPDDLPGDVLEHYRGVRAAAM
jgi:hypothetical protein